MDLFQPFALIFLFLSAALFSFALISTDKSRRRMGFYPFALLLVLSLWTLNSALSLSAETLELKILFQKIWFLTGAFTPTIFLLFSLKYTFGTPLIRFPWALLLFLVPLGFGLIGVTNELHHLTWKSETVSATGRLILDRTWVYYGQLLFGYLELAIGMACLLIHAIRSRGLTRIQTTILFVSGLFPVVTNVALNIFDPLKTLPDLTSLSFAVTGILGAWTLLYFRLFQWAPVARETLVESGADGLVFIDQEGCFLDINTTALKLMGLGSIPYGKRVQELKLPENVPVAALASPTLEPYKWATSDGRFWEGEVTRFKSFGGKSVGLLHQWRDVTLLSNYIEHIEQDRRKIEHLLEERSTLLHVITHDISNSLGAIFLWTDPENDLAPESFEKFKADIFTASKSSIELITFVRELLSAEERKLKLVPVPLKEALKEAKRLVEFRAQGKDLGWEFSGPPETMVLAESVSLTHSVFANLFSNAQKFSPSGGIISVNWEISNNQVVVKIMDRGSGVNEARVPSLFRFETNSSTKGTAGEKGSGFGLPLTSKFMSLYGGHIEYHHLQPHGSEFRLFFRRS